MQREKIIKINSRIIHFLKYLHFLDNLFFTSSTFDSYILNQT